MAAIGAAALLKFGVALPHNACALAMLILGSLSAWGGILEYRDRRGWIQGDAYLDADDVTVGVPFRVRYRQPLRPRTTVAVLAAVALREEIEPEIGRKCDHAARWVEQNGTTPDDGLLQCSFDLALPELDPKMLEVGDHVLKWVFKLRVRQRGKKDVWYEAELPSTVPRTTPNASLEPVYRVTLLKPGNATALTEALRELAPHLDPTQVTNLWCNPPAVVLDNVPLQVAETARRRLEATGSKMEVRRGGEVIEAPVPHNLPISHDAPIASRDPVDALPLPAAEQRDT
jgi:hypothetical protein